MSGLASGERAAVDLLRGLFVLRGSDRFDVGIGWRAHRSRRLRELLEPGQVGGRGQTLDWNALQQGLRSAHAATRAEAVLELHRRLSIAFACMLLGLLGTALGFQGRPSGRGAAVAAAVAVLVAYQALMTSAVAAARGGSLPPSVAPWLPDAALGLLACWVALRSARGLGAWPAPRSRAAAARTPA